MRKWGNIKKSFLNAGSMVIPECFNRESERANEIDVEGAGLIIRSGEFRFPPETCGNDKRRASGNDRDFFHSPLEHKPKMVTM